MKSAAKSENRKALPLFIAIVIVAALVGFGVGFAAVNAEDADWVGAFKTGLSHVLSTAAPYVLVLAAIFLLAYTIIVYKSAKTQIAGLREDDEVALARVDRMLSVALSIVSTLMIVAYFFLAAMLCYMDRYSIALCFTALGCFVVLLVVYIVSQQKFVDLVKRLYPEKRGSVYDMKFVKKWYDSCDEAERLRIGQASRTACIASQTACLALWLLLIVSHMFFQTGLLPIAVVSIIWLSTSITYFVKSIQLESQRVR